MQEKTQGVVLRTLKYNDNSLIVDIYTATRGTVSFMVKLPKSRKATLKGILSAAFHSGNRFRLPAEVGFTAHTGCAVRLYLPVAAVRPV